MDGAHDMGGVVVTSGAAGTERADVSCEWERRAFAITLAMGMPGGWNIDMSRFAREDRPPRSIWPKALPDLARGAERLTWTGPDRPDEIETGKPLHRPSGGENPHPTVSAAMLHRGTDRAQSHEPASSLSATGAAQGMHPRPTQGCRAMCAVMSGPLICCMASCFPGQQFLGQENRSGSTP